MPSIRQVPYAANFNRRHRPARYRTGGQACPAPRWLRRLALLLLSLLVAIVAGMKAYDWWISPTLYSRQMRFIDASYADFVESAPTDDGTDDDRLGVIREELRWIQGGQEHRRAVHRGARLLLPFEPARKRDRDIMAGYRLEPAPEFAEPAEVSVPILQPPEPYAVTAQASDRAAITDTRRRIEAMAATLATPATDGPPPSVGQIPRTK